MKFIFLNSIESMPVTSAAASTSRSVTYVASGLPAHLYASTGTVLVNTPRTLQ